MPTLVLSSDSECPEESPELQSWWIFRLEHIYVLRDFNMWSSLTATYELDSYTILLLICQV